MQKLALGALFVGLLVACGGNNNNKIVLPDSSGSGSGDMCNILTQTGCNAGEKCAWVRDLSGASPLGHVGCAPDGTVAIGSACKYGADGVTGYDDCKMGGVCLASSRVPAASGTCEQVCDQNGGDPMCTSGYACGTYVGLLEVGGMNVAGVCDKLCDVLTDNDFDGSAGPDVRTGTACGPTQGCYGYPGTVTPTHATCSGDRSLRGTCSNDANKGCMVDGDCTGGTCTPNPVLGHRDACTVANGCGRVTDKFHGFLNGCAQGYVPFYFDATGSTQVDCTSFCKPADCSSTASVGCTNFGAGETGNYMCDNLHHIGTFTKSTALANGDQCFYSWLYEYDVMKNHIPSPTSDTLGYCFNHSKFSYDSNGDGSADTPVKACKDMAVGSAAGLDDAVVWGCVSTTTATTAGETPFQALKRRPIVDLPRPAYHTVFTAD